MRLIHTKTGRFHVVDDPRKIRYAILSHVWARENDKFYPEPTLQDVLRIQTDYDAEPPETRTAIISRLPEKVRRFCETAAKYHFDLAWGDSFCIDKTSSSELSEAINSMFDWYRYARLCFVYLSDVAPISDAAELERRGSPFRESRWYRRGWTLQELLAPTSAYFFSSEWTVIGSKHTLAPLIEDITRIPQDILTLQRPLETSSVACRMSWAVGRETTREEDEAYSLMGIFGVKITTTYGEGRYAFIRLQEEILKTISDQTLLAWGLRYSNSRFIFQEPGEDWLAPDMLHGAFNVKISSPHQYLFASSPKDFRYSSLLVSVPWKEALTERPTYTITSYGICTRLPVLSVRIADPQMNAPSCIALLSCKMTDEHGEDRFLALILRPQHSRTHNMSDSFVGTAVGKLRDFMGSVDIVSPTMDLTFSEHYYRTVWLSKGQWEACSNICKLVEVYIPHRPVLAVYNMQRDAESHALLYSLPHQHDRVYDWFELRISKASEDLLALSGYRPALYTTKDPYTILIQKSPSSDLSVIHIDVRRCDCHLGDRERFLSITVSDNRRAVGGQPELHKVNDDRHVRSWSFKNGTASQDFLLRPSETSRVTVRLTLTKSTESLRWPVYILEIEIWETHKGDLKRAQERVHALMSGQGYGYLGGLVGDSSAPPTPLSTFEASPLITPDPSMQDGVVGFRWHGYDGLQTRGAVPAIRRPEKTPRTAESMSTVCASTPGPSSSPWLPSEPTDDRPRPGSATHSIANPGTPRAPERANSLQSARGRYSLPPLGPASEAPSLQVLIEEPEELEPRNAASEAQQSRKRAHSPTSHGYGSHGAGPSTSLSVEPSRNSGARKSKGGRRSRNSTAAAGSSSQPGERPSKRGRFGDAQN